MTREEFLKHKFKGYDIVIYTNKRMKNWDDGMGVEVECMVCAIDYDEEIMLLQTVRPGVFREDEFYANIKNIEFAKSKPKIAFKR